MTLHKHSYGTNADEPVKEEITTIKPQEHIDYSKGDLPLEEVADLIARGISERRADASHSLSAVKDRSLSEMTAALPDTLNATASLDQKFSASGGEFTLEQQADHLQNEWAQRENAGGKIAAVLAGEKTNFGAKR